MTPALEHLEIHLRRLEFALDPDRAPDDAAAMARQADAIEAAEPDPGALPLRTLCGSLGLDPFLRDVVLLAASPVLHPALGARVDLAPGAPWTPGHLLAALSPDVPGRLPRTAAFDDESPLLASGVLHRIVPDEGLLAAPFLHPVVVPWHWIAFLRGARRTGLPDALVERVPPGLDLDAVVLEAPLREELRGAFAALAASALPADPRLGPGGLDVPQGVAVLLTGRPGSGRTLLARALAGGTGRAALVVRASALCLERRAREAIDLACEQAQFFDEPLVVRHADELWHRAPDLASHLARQVRRRRLVALLTAAGPDVGPDLDTVVAWRLALPGLSVDARRRVWEAHLAGEGAGPGADLARLARRPLAGAGVAKAAGAALRTGGAAGLDDWARRAAGDTGPWSQARATALRLDQLVLHDDARQTLDRIVRSVGVRRRVLEDWGFGRVIHRGSGVTCLFDGDPGTGKTLSAEVLANETGLTLRLVNVSAVVDKYIGETEKNLAKVFEGADPERDLLLFDEADALFGKRTEVTRSTDRYANLEINVLLHLMERHEGVVILTTNLKDQIDPAFERRLMFKVKFAIPDAAMRAELWRRLLRADAPLADDVDIEELAERYELAGGAIKNSVLRAAYAAASAGTPVAQALLREAARAEAVAAGHLVREGSYDD